MWDDANKEVGVKTESLNVTTKKLLDRYSLLLLDKVKSKLDN